MATPQLLPTPVAARRLKVTSQTIRRWLASGRLTGQRIGCIWAVDETAVAVLEAARRDGKA
jgi:excisionase family DNA binding protein